MISPLTLRAVFTTDAAATWKKGIPSRLCVKNLPKYVGEERLRDFFSQKGEVTDAKLMRTKDGKSRRFAFIGFRTDQDAEEAIKFFNNTYLDTCRITCEVAHKVGDPNIPRPWSQYSAKKNSQVNANNVVTEDQNANTRTLLESKGIGTVNETAKASKTSLSDDPRLQEFLQIMQPRAKSKFWANDTLESFLFADKSGPNEAKGALLSEGSEKQASKKGVSVADESKRGTKTDPGLPFGNTQDENSDTSTESEIHESVQDEVISDMDYLKSRIKKTWSDSENDEEDNIEAEESEKMIVKGNETSVGGQQARPIDGINDGVNLEEDSARGQDENENIHSGRADYDETPCNTGRLFIRNLPYTTIEDDLMDLFSKYGDVSQVHIVVDKDTKRSKGIGYVHYVHLESAARALKELDNSIFQGRLLHIMCAKPQNPSVERQESNPPLSLKQKREEQRKASESSGDTRAWNSLFIRQDTVVENIARKYGIDKSDVLNKEADDLAVRIALAETHTIAETKKALKCAGVNVAALEEFASGKGSVRRSNHVILVKNLPYSSSEGDLTKMFGKFGSLDKIILPPTKTLALVIFLESAEARAAFKGLAYKRYKDGPLYLEWAPGDILSSKPVSETDKQDNAVGREEVTRVVLEQSLKQMPEGEIDPERVESRSIFVKNLNFRTSDEDLKNHFVSNIKKGAVRSVKVKKHIKNGKNVSMGYGFIEFESLETATYVCSQLQGTILDGHALILQLCHAKKGDQTPKRDEKDKSSTKLIVRNVAFEATEKELRQLFSSFGQVRKLRLPKRIDNHRGFAFVEYVTKQETENAMHALSSTHLYGRRLVIERAKEGETLEELRARTAAQFTAGDQGGPRKKSVKRKRKDAVDEDEAGGFHGMS
ncbi:unnamed protein product [Spirodela intermedia]|uniref:RRM domain-containing protein n=1 Tax=Spirodela intermedia TaxID=51605 RepID=A0A7I8LAG2_SPIIN|nr:unnamed protein product [Spirodela intermedia]